eukprot:3440989-Ditylum_brightwellii.AAC.1
MKGFNSLDALITAPNFHNKLTLHQWFLMICTNDESMRLFSSIDVDPNNVYYFCCNKVNWNEAILWLDNLPELLCISFSHNNLCLIQDSDDSDPSRSYHTEPTENTEDAICCFDQVLNGVMDTVDDIVSSKGIDIEEDH